MNKEDLIGGFILIAFLIFGVYFLVDFYMDLKSAEEFCNEKGGEFDSPYCYFSKNSGFVEKYKIIKLKGEYVLEINDGEKGK